MSEEGFFIAEVRKVRKVKKAAVPDDLISGELEELEELIEDETPEAEEPAMTEEEKERLALSILEASKKEMEVRRHIEKKTEAKRKKVRDPRVELAKTLSVVIVSLIIAFAILFIAYKDYTSDMDSTHDEHTYEAIRDEKDTWVYLHNMTVIHTNETGAETGVNAAKAYKDHFRMDGNYAMKKEILKGAPFLGDLSLELNWVYYLVFAIVVVTGPNGIVRRGHLRKLKKKEEKFPDFIRDLAEFWKGGLSMTVAVDTLSKGDYGALDEEVDFMATQLSWGVAFSEVLRMFLERVHTGLIERSIALIEEANRAGGKISDILLNVAHDAQEIKMLDREREGTMKSYIFVTLISFLIYVVIIVVMAYVFIPAIAESTEGMDEQMTIGGVRIQSFDPSFVALLFFASVVVQAIGGGINAGIMGEGNIGASLWWITIFMLLGIVMFEFLGVKMGMV